MKKEINLTELKKMILKFYGYELTKDNLERILFINEIKNCYKQVGTIIFSIEGSPPKGIAVLQLEGADKTQWRGSLVLIGNGRVSKLRQDYLIKKVIEA